MPPAVGGLLVAAGATFGSALAVGASAGTAAILAGISFGAGMIRRYVFNNRPGQEGIRGNVASGEATLPIIYGTAKVGAKLLDTRVDPASEDNRDLYRVAAFCIGSENGSGVERVNRIWFDERLAVDGPSFQELGASGTGVQDYWVIGDQTGVPYDRHFDYGLYRGSDAQTVDSVLSDTFSDAWPTDARVRGVCYAPFLLRFSKEKWQGIPRVTAEIQGNRVYDPRDGSWKFSDNPALCILDYLTSDRYGYGETYTQRDGGSKLTRIDEQSFIEAANLYDELVSGPNPDTGEMERRFTCNLWLDSGNGLDENLDALLSTCRGTLIDQNGRIQLKTRVATDPVDFELDPSNIVGEWRWIRDGSDEVPNAISARYPSAEDDYATQEVVWPEHGANDFLTSDNDELRMIEAELPGTTDHRRAQEIAQVMLKEAREDVTIEVTCTEEALQLEYGDLVTVTHPTPGWDSKEFWVGSVEVLPPQQGEGRSPGKPTRARLGLREYSDLAYSYSALSDKPTVPGTSLPDPFQLADPTNVTATSSSGTAVELGDGTVQPRVLVTWTPPADAFYDETRIRYRPVADADGNAVSENWQTAPTVDSTDDQQTYLDQVRAGWEYEVEVRAVNTIGTTSSWVAAANVTATATGAVAPIIKPTSSESSDGQQGTLEVEVIDPAGGDLDVEFYQRVGTGGYPASPDKSVTGVASAGTASYTFDLDDDRPTIVRALVTLQSNGNTNAVEITFDAGVTPQIEHLQATVDGDSLEAFVSAAGESDTATIYLTVGDGSPPPDPTPSNADATISGQAGSVNTGVTISEGNQVFVKAVGESSAATGNVLGPVRETAGGTASPGRPNILIDTSESADGTTGQLDATPTDPNGGTLTVRFYTRQGHGSSYGSPDVELTGVPSGTTKTHTVDLIEDKLSWIKVEAEVESNGRKDDEESSFDPDSTAAVQDLSAYIDDDGIVHARASGGSDTASIDLVLGAPINETRTITGREGSYSSTATAAPGETVTVTATPKNAAGTPGSDRVVEAHRGGPGTSDVTPRPTITRVNVSQNSIRDIRITYEIGAESGQAAPGLSSTEAKHRVNGPGSQMGNYSGFRFTPYQVTVQLALQEPKEIEAIARDAGLTPNPESASVTRSVPSIVEALGEPDVPTPSIPTWPDGERGGAGQGQAGGGESPSSPPTGSPGGGGGVGVTVPKQPIEMLDELGVERVVGRNGEMDQLKYADGQVADDLEPAEAGSEQTQGKSLTVLADRTADNVEYQDGTPVEDLEPAEAGSEQTQGKDLDVLANRTADKVSRLKDGETVEDATARLVGATGRVEDQRALVQVNAANRLSTTDPSAPLSGHDDGSSARIDVAAFDIVYGFGKVSYNADSITGLAFETDYFVYFDDPGFDGGNPTYVATTNRLEPLQSDGRVYLGSITTPADGGSGTSGGGGGGCVAADQHLGPDVRVGSAEAGDEAVALVGEDVERLPVQLAAPPRERPCVRLVAENDAAVTCTTDTPVLLDDGRQVPARAADGEALATWVDGRVSWERVDVEPVGWRTVVPLSFGGAVFAAGDDPAARVFTHNQQEIK